MAQSPLTETIRALADSDGFIELPDYIQAALYHPAEGYYSRDRQRVGKTRESDFYTASTHRDAFAAIAIEAATSLLQTHQQDPAAYHWVEIGAEPHAALLEKTDSPFATHSVLRPGQKIEIPKRAIVFSNELFDAQPFRQLRYRDGAWQEFGVGSGDDGFVWQARRQLSPEAAAYRDALPDPAPCEDYTLDLPTGARALAAAIAKQPWNGAFIAFDYGKTWANLCHETPAGTARTYKTHQQGNAILQDPGEYDITHHICWDHIQHELAAAGFDDLSLETQESFIVRRAPGLMQKAFAPSRNALDPLRQKLKELIHPSFMGQKFQAISAVRFHD